MDLTGPAHRIATQLREHGFDDQPSRQVLALAEEAGEFVGAFRRWSGQARRVGTCDEMMAELADVVITAFVFAAERNLDLEAAIAAKLEIVFTRGWRESGEDKS